MRKDRKKRKSRHDDEATANTIALVAAVTCIIGKATSSLTRSNGTDVDIGEMVQRDLRKFKDECRRERGEERGNKRLERLKEKEAEKEEAERCRKEETEEVERRRKEEKEAAEVLRKEEQEAGQIRREEDHEQRTLE
jgi:hypothetical protein